MNSDFSLRDITLTYSPNCEPRCGVSAPEWVVLHYTGMPDCDSALARLRNPAAKVSAHYLISTNGAIFGLVSERARAWHAGVSCWRGEHDVNSRSIGIELMHVGHQPGHDCPPFPERQMAALERLLSAILQRWHIEPVGVLAHSDVAPGRKIDPGEHFDWRRLARRGLAVNWPIEKSAENEHDVEQEAFLAKARVFGYGEWDFRAILDAFRRRFRPHALNRRTSATSADIHVLKTIAPPKNP